MSNGQIERHINRLKKHKELLLDLKFTSEDKEVYRDKEVSIIDKEIELLFKLLRLRQESMEILFKKTK